MSKKLLTAIERIDLFSRFNEGTEIEDAVSALVSGARTLGGLGDDHHQELVLLAVENIIREYVEWLNREGEYYMYSEFDNELFEYFAGEKLTKAQFAERQNYYTENM